MQASDCVQLIGEEINLRVRLKNTIPKWPRVQSILSIHIFGIHPLRSPAPSTSATGSFVQHAILTIWMCVRNKTKKKRKINNDQSITCASERASELCTQSH